jgi:hypothetical protein
MDEPVSRADAGTGSATDCYYSRFPEAMLIIQDHVSASGPICREDVGCLLSKRAFPVDCRIPRPFLQLVKKLG